MHELQTAVWMEAPRDVPLRPESRPVLFSGGPASCYMLAGFTSRPVLSGPWSLTPCRLVARVTSLHDCFNASSGFCRLFSINFRKVRPTTESIAMLDHDVTGSRERGLSKLSGVDVLHPEKTGEKRFLLLGECKALWGELERVSASSLLHWRWSLNPMSMSHSSGNWHTHAHLEDWRDATWRNSISIPCTRTYMYMDPWQKHAWTLVLALRPSCQTHGMLRAAIDCLHIVACPCNSYQRLPRTPMHTRVSAMYAANR